MIPENFTLATYRFTLEALEPLTLPPFKTSALRGGFGHCFKRQVCQYPQPCWQRCEIGNACPYGYLFETRAPEETLLLAQASDIPRPFIMVDSGNRRTRLQAGDRFTFGLTLIGQANQLLPYFIAVFHELGRIGLGKKQGQYRLVEVAYVDRRAGYLEPIYQASDGVVYAASQGLSGAQIMERAAAYGPVEEVTLAFLTPTQIKHQGKLIWYNLSFFVLIKHVLIRLESLSLFHCGLPVEVDFAGLLEQAREITVSLDETYELNWTRRSGRQQRDIWMDGFVGAVTYRGNITPFLPLLLLGELIHVGKKTVFGSGQYQLDIYRQMATRPTSQAM